MSKRLFDAARAHEALKEQLKLSRAELDSALAELGVGTYHQDPTTSAVYKIVKPTGTYIEFRAIDYERTAFSDEKRGSLSKKEAEERGFSLKKGE